MKNNKLQATLRTLTADTRELVEEYRNKHFEYISYKDFCRLLKKLEGIGIKIGQCHAGMDQPLSKHPSKK